jgi:hypothetical protein
VWYFFQFFLQVVLSTEDFICIYKEKYWTLSITRIQTIGDDYLKIRKWNDVVSSLKREHVRDKKCGCKTVYWKSEKVNKEVTLSEGKILILTVMSRDMWNIRWNSEERVLWLNVARMNLNKRCGPTRKAGLKEVRKRTNHHVSVLIWESFTNSIEFHFDFLVFFKPD